VSIVIFELGIQLKRRLIVCISLSLTTWCVFSNKWQDRLSVNLSNQSN